LLASWFLLILGSFGDAVRMTELQPMDFSEIAADLRRASEEARRAAEADPVNSEQLRRKSRDLLSAAQRIEADAIVRQRFLMLNDGTR
jgi:hypothetical protein